MTAGHGHSVRALEETSRARFSRHNVALGMEGKPGMVSFIRLIIAILRSGTQGGGTRRVDTLYDLQDTSLYASHHTFRQEGGSSGEQHHAPREV